MNTELIDYPVSDLPDRYSKARSAIYTQMEKLGVKPTRRGNRSFITPEEIRLLDALNHFLDEDSARDIEDFLRELKEKNVSSNSRSRKDTQTSLTHTEGGLTVVQDIEDYRQDVMIKVLRQRFELLDFCAAKGWLLSTSDLAVVTGLSPRTLIHYSELFRWGFTFRKCTVRSGLEVSWRVISPQPDALP